jgi:hypothetical protein
MTNTQAVETAMMFENVKHLKSPKKVLETLSKCESEMGWHKSEEIRYLTYGSWLFKNKPEWFEYLKESRQFLRRVLEGPVGVETKIPTAPEGWIDNYMEYIRGEIDGNNKGTDKHSDTGARKNELQR